MALSAKHARFVAEYLANGRNATKAAEAAGYSKRTAKQQGSRLLTNVDVKAAIDAKTKKVLSKLEITAERTLLEIARIAYVDPAAFFDSDNRPLSIHEIPEDARRAIAGIEVDALYEGHGEDRYRSGDTVKFKAWSKNEALTALAKHFKLLTDKVEHSGEVNIRVVDPYAQARGG